MRPQTKKLQKFFLLALIPVISSSCATAVTFDVERPPLVDLRNVNSITVIPFEWDSISAYANIARSTTYAFLYGLGRGKIDIVDPYAAEVRYGRNFWRYADVYITGRVTNVWTNTDRQTREEINNRGEKVTRTIVTETVYVEIEYAYIRSVNNEMLGRFTKTAINDNTREFTRDQDGRPQQPPYDFRQGGTWQDGTRGGRRQEGTRPQRIPEVGVSYFGEAMQQEIVPWTATEKRKLKRGTGNNRQVTEARNLIGQNNYAKALEIYKDIYERTGSVFFGYNTAVLLEATENYLEALYLLRALNRRITDSGKITPSFIKNEMNKLEEYLYGFRVLEDY